MKKTVQKRLLRRRSFKAETVKWKQKKRSQTLSSSETDGTVRKASPSEADATEKSEIGGGLDDTEQKASPSDADGTKTDKTGRK